MPDCKRQNIGRALREKDTVELDRAPGIVELVLSWRNLGGAAYRIETVRDIRSSQNFEGVAGAVTETQLNGSIRRRCDFQLRCDDRLSSKRQSEDLSSVAASNDAFRKRRTVRRLNRSGPADRRCGDDIKGCANIRNVPIRKINGDSAGERRRAAGADVDRAITRRSGNRNTDNAARSFGIGTIGKKAELRDQIDWQACDVRRGATAEIESCGNQQTRCVPKRYSTRLHHQRAPLLPGKKAAKSEGVHRTGIDVRNAIHHHGSGIQRETIGGLWPGADCISKLQLRACQRSPRHCIIPEPSSCRDVSAELRKPCCVAQINSAAVLVNDAATAVADCKDRVRLVH